MTQAHSLALKWHSGQMYGDEPYKVHLQEVNTRCYNMYKASLSLEDMYFVANLAWLHDILEDTECTPADIQDALGHYPPTGWVRSAELIEAVEAITKGASESRSDYLERCSRNPFALKVKIADTLCNLERSFISQHTRRIEKYLKQLAFLSTKI